jgi:hypothetical protein
MKQAAVVVLVPLLQVHWQSLLSELPFQGQQQGSPVLLPLAGVVLVIAALAVVEVQQRQ